MLLRSYGNVKAVMIDYQGFAISDFHVCKFTAKTHAWQGKWITKLGLKDNHHMRHILLPSYHYLKIYYTILANTVTYVYLMKTYPKLGSSKMMSLLDVSY